MANIRVTQAHSMSLEEARAAAQEVTDKLAAKFDFKSNWSGNTLNFKRSGVDGSLAVTTKEATIDIKLGFMLGMMSGKIEEEAKLMMHDVFVKRASKI
jgi:putative polyhydroxyalkanoate system protein